MEKFRINLNGLELEEEEDTGTTYYSGEITINYHPIDAQGSDRSSYNIYDQIFDYIWEKLYLPESDVLDEALVNAIHDLPFEEGGTHTIIVDTENETVKLVNSALA